jgi:hypothetical protein
MSRLRRDRQSEGDRLMACTEKCRQETAKRRAEIDAWRNKWPKACELCLGAGGKSFPGSFDHRAGVGEPPHFEPCECLMEGRCPCCGDENAFPEDENDGMCRFCGWHEGDNQQPEPYECGCWYTELLAEEDGKQAEIDSRQFDEEP